MSRQNVINIINYNCNCFQSSLKTSVLNMANPPNNEDFDRRRALSLLEEATQYLECSGTVQDDNSVRPPASNNLTDAERGRNRPRNERDNVSRHGRELDNFGNLFGPYRTPMPPCRNSAMQVSLPPPSKRKKGNKAFNFKKETWTHDFFCFADKD